MEFRDLFENAHKASRDLALAENELITRVLLLLADDTEKHIPFILAENKKDLMAMPESDPRYDRLQLTAERLESIASDIRKIALLPSPAGKVLSEYHKPNGLIISRVSVPMGIIGIIYESRPNVTFDVFSLCLRSGNVCILKGGSDAANSNSAAVSIIKKALRQCGINENVISLLPPGREETSLLLKARGKIDLLIPRGSQQLISYVRENATVPVIETGAGICHTYFDETGELEKGKAIVKNAKTRRVSVCNALDCLIVHEKRLGDLPELLNPCAIAGVIVYADEDAYTSLEGKYPSEQLFRATPETFGTEFLSNKMSVKTAVSFSDAIDHISKYGSGHSEAIISEDVKRIDDFNTLVDASALFSNTSTAFTDGSEFGLGAEIGISTQKLHARGPMALEALTTYKWIIRGNGQVRP